MKAWIKSHYKTILIILLCIAYYLFLFSICIDYIDFERGIYEETEHNILVAIFYFIVLPIASVLPIVLYLLSAFIGKKTQPKIEENQKADMQHTKDSADVEDQSNSLLVKKEWLLIYAALSNVPANVRNGNIESIIYSVYNNHNPLTITKESLPYTIVEESERVPKDKKPLYLLAASYAFLYCRKDTESAVKHGKETLQEIHCYSKFNLKDTYIWLSKEPNIVAQLFDERGYSKLLFNPLRYNLPK